MQTGKTALKDFYKDKIILVTGGVGSIGSNIVKSVLKFNPKTIRILDNNETRLYEFSKILNDSRIRLFVGDVRDKDRLKRAIENVDIVFHAAALKHVPLCEYNPFEAVKTNVLGTQNLIDVAIDEEVEKFITISTDKAVNPINVMGATKLLTEKLTIAANIYKGKRKTAFSCVRFGNVLNTRGSVIPIFKIQIKNFKTITITDSEMTRFMMSIPKAVNLVLKAAMISTGGEIFILKMPALKVIDLAEVLIDYFAPKFGYNPSEIKIEFIGRRPGEKIYEELMTDDEAEYAYENEEMYIILPYEKMFFNKSWKVPPGFKKAKKISYKSKDVPLLDKHQIEEMISELNL